MVCVRYERDHIINNGRTYNLQVLVTIYTILVSLTVLAPTTILAGAKTYGATKPYTYEQQIRRGEREAPKLVTARRVYRGFIGGNQVCIYIGAKNSNETIVTGKDDWCPGSMQVPYSPNPNFNWRETVKKMKETSKKH